MCMSEYENSYGRWISSLQTFDYYAVAVCGAALAFTAHNFAFSHFGWNQGTVELSAMCCLFAAFYFGLKRAELVHMLLRFENEKIGLTNHRDEMRRRREMPGGVVREGDLSALSADEVDDRINRYSESINRLSDELKKTGEKMGLMYGMRDRLLIVGVVILLLAKIIFPSVHSKPGWQAFVTQSHGIVRVHAERGEVEYFTSEGWLPPPKAYEVLNRR